MNQDTEAITKREVYQFLVASCVLLLFLSPISIPLRQLFSNSLVQNILGGIIVAVLAQVYIWIRNYHRAYKFRNIFGQDVNRQFFIVYGLMNLSPTFNEDGTPMRMPYYKPEKLGLRFGNIVPASASQLRGAQYISTVFGKNIKNAPELATDIDIKNRMDISFCSIGGTNNLKTTDILECEDNVFFKFDSSIQSIVGKNNSQLKFTIDGFHDYGFIIKLNLSASQNRTWIGIAGLGEWGTSGAAWYLARNWEEIEKKHSNNSFGIIVKVQGGKDESAQLVYDQ